MAAKAEAEAAAAVACACKAAIVGGKGGIKGVLFVKLAFNALEIVEDVAVVTVGAREREKDRLSFGVGKEEEEDVWERNKLFVLDRIPLVPNEAFSSNGLPSASAITRALRSVTICIINVSL